jgi:phenylacetate-coenzyme A ligase PaaK-like adenylate-forming protein
MGIGKLIQFDFNDNINNKNENNKNNRNKEAYSKVINDNKKGIKNDDLKKIEDLWKRGYNAVVGRVCILNNIEISLLKKLLKIYSFEELKKMIYYYFRNYENLPFYKKKEIPKIRILYYFKDDFFENSKDIDF